MPHLRSRSLLLASTVLVALALLLWPRRDATGAAEALSLAAKALSPEAGESPEQRRERLSTWLDSALSEDAEITILAGRSARGRDAVRRAALELGEQGSRAVSLAHVQVQLEGSSTARASFDVVLSDSRTPDLHSETRRGRAELVRVGGRWLLRRVEVTAEALAEPEARP